MTSKDFVGKTFTVGDINGNSNWRNELLEWYGRRQLEGTITINRITDKNTVFFTLDITKPYRKHFDEMRGKMHGIIKDENGDWGEDSTPYIIRNFDSWGNVEWRGRYHLWRFLPIE